MTTHYGYVPIKHRARASPSQASPPRPASPAGCNCGSFCHICARPLVKAHGAVDFTGGGTFFVHYPLEPGTDSAAGFFPDIGGAIVHGGKSTHYAAPILTGSRYVLAFSLEEQSVSPSTKLVPTLV